VTTLYYHEKTVTALRKASVGWTGDWPAALRYAADMADTAKALAEVMVCLLEPGIHPDAVKELRAQAQSILNAMHK